MDSPVHATGCEYCGDRFPTNDELVLHYRADHAYCDECKRPFKHDGSLKHHIENSNQHVDEFRCVECDRTFRSSRALDDHLRYATHSVRKPAIVLENYCARCDKQFATSSALEQHLGSLAHAPISKELECPFGCPKMFPAPSALLHHLESGYCRSKLTKDMLDQAVLANDTAGLISNASGSGSTCLEFKDDDTNSTITTGGGVVLTPRTRTASASNSSPVMTPRTGATESAILTPQWTPAWSESTASMSVIPRNFLCCPLCPGRRAFGDMLALNQHISSSVHAPKLYHCPVSLVSGRQTHLKTFSTLSGLSQHIEARACKGGGRMLEQALQQATGVLQGRGFGHIKLVTE